MAVAASLFVLRGAPDTYPIDDAYIHFAYADNLAAGRGLIFQTPAETGLGTTSALWVGLLAVGDVAGVPTLITARVLGVLALAGAAGLVVRLVEPAARRLGAPWAALAAGALTAVCGPLLWFALSGMETMLFAALGLTALLAYRSGRWRALGVCLGLLCLTRPEGIGLALAIGAIEIARLRRIPAQLWQTAAAGAIILLPWIGYVFWRTGDFLPGSYYGKQFSQQVAIDYFAGQVDWLAPVARLRPLVFASLSFGFWVLNFWGGAYLPGPRIQVSAQNDQLALPLSLAAIAVAIVWLALIARGAANVWRSRRQADGADNRAWLAFGAWIVLHNAAFALLLPAPGTASRYIVVDYLLLASGVALGLAPGSAGTRRPDGAAQPRPRAPARWVLAIAGLMVAAVSAATLEYWRNIYVSSARQVAEVRIPMAEAVEQVAPPQSVVAAFDIGVIAYYADRPVADLGGLTDRRFLKYAAHQQVDDYLCEVGARYLVAPDSSSQSGGSYYDYLGSLGLSANPEVKLTQVASVSMNEADWRIGGAATGNSTAAVLLYEVEPVCAN